MDEERRRNGGLSERQFETLKTKLRAELREELKEHLKEELYEELWDDVSLRVGKTVLKTGLYIVGAVIAALGAWLHGAGKIPFLGGE